MASDGEGSFDLPSARRHNMGASPAPPQPYHGQRTLWPLKRWRRLHHGKRLPRLDTDLPLERWHTHQEGKRALAHAQPPCIEQEVAQWWDKLVGGQVAPVAWPHVPPWHEPPLEEEGILMMDYMSERA
jgi:hypothetical protein